MNNNILIYIIIADQIMVVGDIFVWKSRKCLFIATHLDFSTDQPAFTLFKN